MSGYKELNVAANAQIVLSFSLIGVLQVCADSFCRYSYFPSNKLNPLRIL